MAKQLVRTVTLLDEEDGQYYTYKPGDTVPDNHAKLITNEKAWGDPEADEDLGPPPGEGQLRPVDEKDVEAKATATQSTEPGAAPGDSAPKPATKSTTAAKLGSSASKSSG